jgi:hypothetical protein
MLRARTLRLFLFAASLLVLAPRADADPALYVLSTPPSSLEIGCQGPCACPLLSKPTYGSFQLVKTGFDPLYTYYDVVGYIASYNNGPGAVSITGSGHYRVGGEFALVQQMTLDLDIEGRPTEHFDSGLKPVGAPFPQIDIACAVHGFFCYDTVLVVNAKPVSVTGIPPAPRPARGFEAAWPNPFEHGIRFTYALDHPGPVALLIVDLEGRRVRALPAAPAADTGPQSASWDGRRDDGRMAPAGVYWVLLRWPGGADQRRIVKLG